MILSDEEAKAIAKVTVRAIDVITGAGTALVNGTVGNISEAVLGLAGGDWVQEARKRNRATMQAKTARLLDSIDRERLGAPSVNVVVPLLDAAANESREELQNLWAALLANAMLGGGQKVRRDYFEALRKMETADAILLEIYGRTPKGERLGRGLQEVVDDLWGAIVPVALKAGLSVAECQISAQALIQSGCVEVNYWGLTPFGRGLLDACQVT